MYIMNCTRPDIAYSISKLSRYTSNPGENHWKALYTLDTVNGYVIVYLYVDDMLIIGSNNDIIKATKRILTSEFDMKELGVADVILGMKISRKSEGLVLS